ncbi:hypothetical protein, partial [Roseiconus lacunae]|uniref:hypothetical protein n=1 Tax=Roseiconus lacunae TaxID=2605694 RepID=UPI001F2B23DE
TTTAASNRTDASLTIAFDMRRVAISADQPGNDCDNGVAAKHRERRNQLRRNSRSSHGSSLYGCRRLEVGRRKSNIAIPE